MEASLACIEKMIKQYETVKCNIKSQSQGPMITDGLNNVQKQRHNGLTIRTKTFQVTNKGANGQNRLIIYFIFFKLPPTSLPECGMLG